MISAPCGTINKMNEVKLQVLVQVPECSWLLCRCGCYSWTGRKLFFHWGRKLFFHWGRKATLLPLDHLPVSWVPAADPVSRTNENQMFGQIDGLAALTWQAHLFIYYYTEWFVRNNMMHYRMFGLEPLAYAVEINIHLKHVEPFFSDIESDKTFSTLLIWKRNKCSFKTINSIQDQFKFFKELL